MNTINNKTELATALRTIHKYQVMEAEAKAAKAAVKAYMEANAMDTVTAGGFNATVKAVESKRFDSATFKAEQPELYAKYSVTDTSVRLYVK